MDNSLDAFAERLACAILEWLDEEALLHGVVSHAQRKALCDLIEDSLSRSGRA